MLYDSNNPESLFWDFLSYGRGGRVLTVQQQTSMARKTRRQNFDD